MITTSTSPFLHFDSGKNEPGMTLQRWDGNDWMDYKVEGKVVKSPVDIYASRNKASHPLPCNGVQYPLRK
jgi:hypothetical protein